MQKKNLIFIIPLAIFCLILTTGCINNKNTTSNKQIDNNQTELPETQKPAIYGDHKLEKNCKNNSDCVGRCSPFGCFNKESTSELRIDCRGPKPTCACVNNNCEETGREI